MKPARNLAVHVGFCALACAVSAHAQTSYTTATPHGTFDAERYAGAEFRKVLEGVATTSQGTPAVMAGLLPVLAFCDERVASKGAVHASVSTKAEEQAFRSSQPAGTRLDFVDMACPRAYVTAAFTTIDAGDAARAGAFLEKARKLAPYWADPWTEGGFLLNAHGDRAAALASYRHALDLAKTWPASQESIAIALRGIGWTLIEQGDYAGARQAYRESLEADPGNTLALDELAFIEKNQAKGAPNTPIFDTTVQQDETSLARRKFAIQTRSLEIAPFADDAPAMRKEMIAWLDKTPTVQVLACDLLDLGAGTDHGKAELLVQYMFGNATEQITHPEHADDPVAVQLAGVRSALRAYRNILAGNADLRLEPMDALLRHEDAGDLEAFLKPRIEAHCKPPAEPPKTSGAKPFKG